MKLRFKKYFAELLGTMMFVFFSCGAVIVFGTDYKKGTAYLISALAAFLAFVAMSYSISRLSGCHLNPAVSLSKFIIKEVDALDLLGYTISQIIGSFAACGLLTGVFWGHTGNYGANTFYNANPYISLLVEFILTITFVCVFLFTDKEKNSGIYKGLALLLTGILGIQLTGASVNPAKSLASAIFAGKDAIGEVWVFVLAPLLGAAVAALIYMCFSENGEENENTNGNTADNTESTNTVTQENDSSSETENL